MSRLHYLSNFLFVSVYLFIAVVLLFCISVNFVQAAPTFEEPVNYIIGDLGDGEHGGNISDAVVVDLNDDGHLDIAGAIPEAAYDVNGAPNPDQGVVTLLNDGTGNFTVTSYVVYEEMPTSIVSADFDDDGDVDLATNTNNDDVVILDNDGEGQFVVVSRPGTGYGSEKLMTADFNDDGNMDIAASVVDATQSGLPEGNPGVHIFLNDGEGAFVLDSTILMSTPGFSRISDFTVSDFDNDGDVDVVAGSGNGVLIYTLGINNGDGLFETSVVTLPIPEAEFSELVSADIDDDGDEDILVNGVETGLDLLLNDGTGNFIFVQNPEFGNLDNLTATDYDDDGDIDVAATNLANNEVYLLTNDSSGTLIKENVATIPFGFFTSVHMRDVNNDEKNDIIISSAQQLGIWIILQANTDEPTPLEQIQSLIATVIALDLPNTLENSYLVNLYRAEAFIGRDQITRAVIQLNTFIVKVNVGYTLGLITEQERNILVDEAQHLIDDLTN